MSKTESHYRHPTAVIHEATRLDDSVIIGPYAVIEDGVEIGEGSIIGEHAILRSGTVLGRNCRVDAHVVLGGLPQDLSFDPRTPSGVLVGDGVTFREGVTVNRATREGHFTEVGPEAFLMANCHVGHDCVLGAHVILANGVLLGGHVTIGRHTFVGGAAAMHQFIRIGESAMISGLSRVSQDVPPFCLMAERNELVGLNLVGIRRRGMEKETVRELKRLYHLVYGIEGRPRVLAAGALGDRMASTEEGRSFLEFITAESKKGMIRPRKSSESEA